MKTSKKKTRVYWLISVFAFIVLGMAWLQFFYPLQMKPEMWIGVIGSLVAIYFGLLRHWMDHDKMFKELFLELNARFDKMNEDLNAIVKKEPLKGGKSSNQVIQDYLNLCAEEFLWYRLGRIDEDVWISWKRGMDYYWQNSEEVENYFIREKDFNQSYYRLFDELKIKETKEKIKDSN
jgi:hypothetical protein